MNCAGKQFKNHLEPVIPARTVKKQSLEQNGLSWINFFPKLQSIKSGLKMVQITQAPCQALAAQCQSGRLETKDQKYHLLQDTRTSVEDP
jgi:hypothetical protein